MSTPASPPHIPDHTLMHRIGEGAYGEVWLARSALGQPRAVKIVRRDRFTDPRPYEREYAGIQRYEPVSRTHEGLMDVLQVGPEKPLDWFYYVMELADDANPNPNAEPVVTWRSYVPKTLHQELQRRGRLPVAECIQLGLALCRALEHLHGLGLVHRDLKPSNVIFVGGIPKLSDPGLVAGSIEPASLVGTTGYVPPEGPGKPVADLYSLGRLLYSASTGRTGEAYPEPPSDLGTVAEREGWAELNAILLKACSERPSERYPSADAMRKDLVRIEAGESIRVVQRARRRIALFRRWATVSTAGAVLLGGLAAWEIHQGRQLQQAKEETRVQLVRSLENNGLRAFEAQQLPDAALWFLETLKLAKTPAEAERARIRIGMALRMTPKRLHLEAHSSPVTETCFSRDGQRVFAGYEDGTARIWDAATFQPKTPLMRHDGTVHSAEFSPDGRWLVTACADRRVRVWDASSGRLRQSMEADDILQVIRFRPDGHWIAGGGDSGKLHLWQLSDGARIETPQRHGARIRALEFSPDGRWMATAGLDETARLWNARTGEPVGKALRPALTLARPELAEGFSPAQRLRCVAFSRDSRLLAAGGAGAVVQVWNVPDGTPTSPPIGAPETYWIGFSWNGKQVITAGGNIHTGGEARIWHVANGQAVGPPLRHGHLIRSADLSPDGRWLLTASHDHTSKLWDLHQSEWTVSSPAMLHGDRVWQATFNPADPTRWMTSGRDGCWQVWQWMPPGSVEWSTQRNGDVGFNLLSPHGDCAAVEHTSTLEVIGISSPQFTNRFEVPIQSKVRWIDFSSDGRWLAVLQEDGSLMVRSSLDGRRRGRALSLGDQAHRCRFSPDGRTLAVIQKTNVLVLSTTEFDEENGPDGAPIAPLGLAHSMDIHEAIFSPDSGFLLTGSGIRSGAGPGEFNVWSRADGARVFQESLPMTVVKILFSPDGQRLAVASADDSSRPSQARLRSAADWKPIGLPLSHGDGVSSLAFSPVGHQLATGCDDGSVRLWDARTAKPLGSLGERVGGVGQLCFSHDGRYLAIGYRYSHIQVWDTEVQQLITPELRELAELSSLRFFGSDHRLASAAWSNATRLWNLGPATNDIRELESIITGLAWKRVVDGALVRLTPADLKTN